MKSFSENFQIALDETIGLLEKKSAPRNVCWKGYKMVGKKKKNGRTVPNCVPAKNK
jgi:hypothetical protein